ncbi:hypothetical protein, partial [Effusibacillus consociatus]
KLSHQESTAKQIGWITGFPSFRLDGTTTLWTHHYYVNTSPGGALYTQDSRYHSGWETRQMNFRAAKCDACNSQSVTAAGPNSTPNTSTPSVSLNSSGISASWNWQAPNVRVDNYSYLPSYGRWEHFYYGAARGSTYQAEPGIQMTNTSGNMVVDNYAYVEWFKYIDGVTDLGDSTYTRFGSRLFTRFLIP